MCDRPCTCVLYRGKRWDDQDCPHPEHGKHYRPDRSIRIGDRMYYPGELITDI
jgi:hypothetical protein